MGKDTRKTVRGFVLRVLARHLLKHSYTSIQMYLYRLVIIVRRNSVNFLQYNF